MNEKLGTLKIKLENEPTTTLLMILLLHVPYLSVEGLCYFFCGASPDRIKVTFNNMSKRGQVNGDTLYPHNKKNTSSNTIDGRTTTVYSLTKKGFSSVCHYVGLKADGYKKYKTGKYILHNYSNGFNFFALLTSPFVGHIYDFFNEAGATFGRSGPGDGRSLFIDSYAKVNGDTLYLEQDMGTEHVTTELREKLIKYGYQSGFLTDGYDRTHVILSFKKGFTSLVPQKNDKSNPRYNARILKNTLYCFEEYRLRDSSIVTLENLISVLQNNPFEKTHHEDDAICLYEDVKKIKDSDVADHFKTYETLEATYEGLAGYNCVPLNIEMNRIQSSFTVSKRNLLLKDMLAEDYTDMSHLSHDTGTMLISGYHVHAVPTALMHAYLPLICYAGSGLKTIIEKSLRETTLFNGLYADSYEPYFSIDNHSPYRKENCPIPYGFCISNKYETKHYIVCVENLATDLGAAVRLNVALKALNTGALHEGAKKVAVIALVNSMEEAAYFNRLLNISGTIPHNSSFNIYFIDISDTYRIEDDRVQYVESYSHTHISSDFHDFLFAFYPDSHTLGGTPYYIPLSDYDPVFR